MSLTMEHNSINVQFIQFLKSKFKKPNVVNQYSIFYNTPASIISGLSILIKMEDYADIANLYHVIEEVESKIFSRFFDIIQPTCLNTVLPPGVTHYTSVANTILNTMQSINLSVKSKENIVVKFNTIEEHKNRFIINYHIF